MGTRLVKRIMIYIKYMEVAVDGEWGMAREFEQLLKQEPNDEGIRLYKILDKVLIKLTEKNKDEEV